MAVRPGCSPLYYSWAWGCWAGPGGCEWVWSEEGEYLPLWFSSIEPKALFIARSSATQISCMPMEPDAHFTLHRCRVSFTRMHVVDWDNVTRSSVYYLTLLLTPLVHVTCLLPWPPMGYFWWNFRTIGLKCFIFYFLYFPSHFGSPWRFGYLHMRSHCRRLLFCLCFYPRGTFYNVNDIRISWCFYAPGNCQLRSGLFDLSVLVSRDLGMWFPTRNNFTKRKNRAVYDWCQRQVTVSFGIINGL